MTQHAVCTRRPHKTVSCTV